MFNLSGAVKQVLPSSASNSSDIKKLNLSWSVFRYKSFTIASNTAILSGANLIGRSFSSVKTLGRLKKLNYFSIFSIAFVNGLLLLSILFFVFFCEHFLSFSQLVFQTKQVTFLKLSEISFTLSRVFACLPLPIFFHSLEFVHLCI